MPKRISCIEFAILTLLLFACSGHEQRKPLSASTGKPELLEAGSGAVLFAMTEENYQKLAAQLENTPAFIPMKKKPANLGPQARFGINFVLEGTNRTWVLDGNEEKGYILHADLNGNGDLSDDPPRAILLPGYPAPLFSFIDLEGKKHDLQDYRGRIVLLDFWGTWCGPCVAAAPELVEIYQRYNPLGFDIIGIDCGDSEEKLLKFISEKNMSWLQTREQEGGPIQKTYRVVGYPTYYLIGKDGTIVSNQINISELPADLEKLLVTIREQAPVSE
jgi:thiol-disulfide isomerase/thioredoxin